MIRILFSDGSPAQFAELKRVFQETCPDWEIVYGGPGAKALGLLAEQPFEVVVADANALGCNGQSLLTSVADRHPDCVRIQLSDHAHNSSMPQLVGPAHQYLPKPCEPEVLQEAVQRAFVLQRFLTDAPLKRLVTQIQALPMVPAVYHEILRELRKEDPSASELSHLIAQDLGMCAKLLQLVNSPFFGLTESVTNPAEAIFYLGINTVRRLVLSVGIMLGFATQSRTVSFDQLWNHSWNTGVLAKELSEMELGDAHWGDLAFLAGLLHDVGKLVLAAGLGERYAQVIQRHRLQRLPLWQAEFELLGSTHAEVGAYLLGLWGMPTPLVEAVALHHRPSLTPPLRFSLTTALHAANCLHHEKNPRAAAGIQSQLDLSYLEQLDLLARVPEWRKELNTEMLRVPA